jgi:hypothetical protein
MRRSLVDIGTKVPKQASHDMLVPLICCDTQSREATLRNLVDIDATFPEQVAHDMLVPILSSDV